MTLEVGICEPEAGIGQAEVDVLDWPVALAAFGRSVRAMHILMPSRWLCGGVMYILYDVRLYIAMQTL